MAILPWDDWIYHLSYKRNEVNTLHDTAVHLQDQIQQQVDVYNESYLKPYQTLVAANSTLVIIANTVTMKDLQYKDFEVQVNAVENPPIGSVPLTAGSLIAELRGSALVLKAVWNLGKLAKSGLIGKAPELPEAAGESATEELAESATEAGVEASAEDGAEITAETVGEGVAEGAAEAAIEGASLATLGEIGIGIFVAVGVDAIFGAINGASENAALDSAISRLNTAISKCHTYYKTILSKQNVVSGYIVQEEKRFQNLVSALAQVTSSKASGIDNQPTFNYGFEANFANVPLFLGAMRSAIVQYGAFASMRNDWAGALDRNPNITKKAFLDAEAVITSLDATTLDRYFQILAAFSDSMAVKASAGAGA